MNNNHIENDTKRKVLIVDDLPENLMVLDSILSVNGYDVITTSKSTEALNIAKTIKPDVILLDILMPEMDGFEVCRKLKADDFLADIPVIYITVRDQELIKGFETGAVDYITKPFNFSELIARVNVHSDLKRTKDELIKKNIMLDEKNIQLEEANRAKNKFFAIIAHDLRSPLSSVSSAIYLLRDHVKRGSGEKNEELELIVDSLSENAKITRSLLDNLLEWSLLQADGINLVPENINLKELTKECTDLLKDSASIKKVSYSVLVKDDIAIVADKNMIKSVIMNLFSNAIKYSPAGGLVELKAEEANDNIIITVSDNGSGIKETDISRIFEIDRNFKRRGTGGERGSGLGLALSKEFVVRNKGKIWVKSKEGEGSKFHVELPDARSFVKS